MVTDDPSVIESTLEKYADLVQLDSSSALQRFVLSDTTLLSDDTLFLIIDRERIDIMKICLYQ